jgi:DNA-binding beta-propeller fold protein YncE
VDPASGNIVATEFFDDNYDPPTSRVQVFDSQGNLLRSFGSFGTGDGQLNGPMGAAVDTTTGNVVVADTFNGRIQVFDSQGNFLRKFGSFGGGEFRSPSGVAVDASGNIYVAAGWLGGIQVFDSQGTFITNFDSFGTDRGAFFPTGVAVDASGNVVVADTSNDSIRVFVP